MASIRSGEGNGQIVNQRRTFPNFTASSTNTPCVGRGGWRFGGNSHFFDAQRTLEVAKFLAKIAFACGGIGEFVLDDLLQSMA